MEWWEGDCLFAEWWEIGNSGKGAVCLFVEWWEGDCLRNDGGEGTVCAVYREVYDLK